MPRVGDLDIAPRPKASRDLTRLLEEVRVSPFIGEITTDELAGLIRAGTIFFFYDGAALIGFGAWSPIGARWVEVGPLFIADAYRGQGVGWLIFDAVVEAQQGHSLYGVTKNPVVKKMFEKRGFRAVALWEIPPVIWLHLIQKLNLRKLIRHARKLRLQESVGHYVKTGE